MADSAKFFSKFRLVKKRSGKLTIIAILTALHLSMSELKNRTEDLRDKAATLEAENEELQEDIEQADSIKGIVKIAENELGLVQPDSVFYRPES